MIWRTANIEHRMKEEEKPKYDLEERLLDFGAAIITLTRKLNGDYAERHVGNQLLRSGTAPLSHHGEAQAAESSADFIHKMRLALKELRESERWLKLIEHAKAGSLRFPRFGSGARYGASVSIMKEPAGHLSAVLRTSRAFLKVATPPKETSPPRSSTRRAFSHGPMKQWKTARTLE